MLSSTSLDSTFDGSEFLSDMHSVAIGPEIGAGEFSKVFGKTTIYDFLLMHFCFDVFLFFLQLADTLEIWWQ